MVKTEPWKNRQPISLTVWLSVGECGLVWQCPAVILQAQSAVRYTRISRNKRPRLYGMFQNPAEDGTAGRSRRGSKLTHVQRHVAALKRIECLSNDCTEMCAHCNKYRPGIFITEAVLGANPLPVELGVFVLPPRPGHYCRISVVPLRLAYHLLTPGLP
ncbi:hypothetical protein RRG08_044039 [Elysia crispata]|uniref:Uncharacterized protein n=1 Tax=Elysia crispata TaxID=231223 RepID=A0AAE0Y2F6_9GAST|nr:hypothetical protein RRG08_044039 [Elysia crispata]